jgi:CheY-like chemotaxis protein
MSHEIRTPMNAIMGMTHLALMDAQLPDKARHYLDKAHRAAGNLLQILNDVLDVSKIESGKLELEYTDFQLETVVSHMADVLGIRAEEKGLELLFTAPPDVPTALIGDPIRLGQVLINLGTNAIKFTEQGEVLIGCEVQREGPSDVVLHFWVQDTGIGLTEAQIERIFLPFTQADSSTTRQYGGTGLGLAISRQLVELMRGHIWVQSRPGKGATFHFTASFGLQTHPRVRRALTAEELQGKRLLLVDDNAMAREVLGDMARRLGMQVETADGGEAALARMHEAAASGQPHHILMTDWKMPGMDGIAFARQALSIPPELRPCVLLVTAFAREEAMQAAQGVGLAGVLNKPVTPSTLMESLCLALSPSSQVPQREHLSSRVLRQAQRQLAGARVLLVEDQPMNQELARDLLERAGITVVTAGNGQEALQILETDSRFDGVLMDCQMPVMDGYTATERIRSRPEWHQLPVIAMTAGAMTADRERVLRSGMNDHITKPLELGQMFTILARWIRPAQPALAPAPHVPEAAPLPTAQHIDVQDGLARCMGHWPLYERLIKGFARTQHDFAAQLAREPSREATLRAVHTFKGLAGNIGAGALFDVALQLEQAMADTDTEMPLEAPAVQTCLADTEAALQAVLSDIAQLLQHPAPTPAATPSVTPDAPMLQDHWAQLAALIEQADAQSRDALAAILQQWPDLRHHADVKAMQQALDHYDFERAAAALARGRTAKA